LWLHRREKTIIGGLRFPPETGKHWAEPGEWEENVTLIKWRQQT
jgi:hypothetical protein